MWRASILSIAALATLPCADAITLHKRDDPAVLGLPVSRSERSQVLQKRDSKTVSTSLYNVQNMYYMVNITVGTPPQNLSLSLDTGSSDIWVNLPNSTFCEGEDDPCSSTGLFDIKKSSSFEMLDYVMNATYASGFLAYGHYATDTLSIGGAKVKDMEFAVAETSLNPHGILGIGYSSATVAAMKYGKKYKNLPEALVESGAIKSPAYSLWLNKFDGTGNLLLGGVNKARYQGELQTVPVLKVYDIYASLAIALTDISIKGPKETNSYSTGLPLAVSLDNGSPLITLPKELVDPIYKEVGAGYSEEAKWPYIPCKMSKSDYNVTFSFSGAKITMPLSELVFDNYSAEGFDEDDCLFGLSYSEEGVNLMGDPFLRGAYVVYDLSNNEISLANANDDGGDDDIHEIGTGTDAVPDATEVPSPVTSATGNGPIPTTGTEYVSGPGSAQTTYYVASSATGDATGTATKGGATSTSSEGLAAFPTGKPNRLLSGVLGAGMLLAL